MKTPIGRQPQQDSADVVWCKGTKIRGMRKCFLTTFSSARYFQALRNGKQQTSHREETFVPSRGDKRSLTKRHLSLREETKTTSVSIATGRRAVSPRHSPFIATCGYRSGEKGARFTQNWGLCAPKGVCIFAGRINTVICN